MEYLQRKANRLMQAIERRDWQTVRRICETEEHLINTYDKVRETPLMYAVRYDAPDNILLTMIAKATLKNLEHKRRLVDDSTILHLLVFLATVTPLRSALERTKNVNVTDNLGRTPLHDCLRAPLRYDEHRETAMCLMMHGASISIKDMFGRTPLDVYDDNKCGKYKETTRSKKKQLLKKLLIELSTPAEIVARGETAVKAFEYEMQNGEITVVNARFMFMGKEGAGKTSCVNHMLGKAFNRNEPSTDGIVTTTIFQTVGEDCRKWEEQTGVDVCELTKEIREHAIAGNVAKRLKPPESQRQSSPNSTASPMEELEEATNVMTLDEREKPHISHHVKGIVSTNRLTGGNAITLPDGIHKKLLRMIDNQRFGQVNVDGPSDVTSIWDYAGQLKYYITHRMFLTGRTSYGVVFSLLDDLDALAKSRNGELFEMTNLQMIVFWFRSIYEYAVLLHNVRDAPLINGEIQSPPISLIATHKDKLSGNQADKEMQIHAKFKKIFDAIEKTAYEKHVDRTMYAVDNTTQLDEGIEKLKANVGGYMKAMATTVPTNWVEFQYKVQKVGKRRLRLPLHQITKIAATCGISEDKYTTVLDYLHDTGIILYSKTNKKLKNTVIINLRMMIDFLTKIITVVKPDDIDKVPVMMTLWHRLDYEGILEEKLLRHLWRHEIAKDASNFDVFLELMKVFGLLFEKKSGENEQDNRTFIVPSRMKVNKKGLEFKNDEMQTISIYVTPTDFLPDAVYNMLVVSFLNLMAVKGRNFDHAKLFRNCSDFDIDDDHVVRLGTIEIVNRNALKLEISHTIQVDEHNVEEALEPKPSFCIEVLNYLREQLKSVYGTIEGVGYELRMRCNKCGEPTLQSLHNLEECLMKDSVRCGNSSVKMTRFQRLFTTGFDEKSTQEIMNFLALQTLIVGRGTKELRRYFKAKTGLAVQQIKPFLVGKRQHGVLKDVDFGDQAAIVFSSANNFEEFDMSIMMKLIRYCCGSNHDDSFWENPPDDDNGELANLVRIYKYKKNVLDSSYSNRVTDEEFDNRWKELTAMFTGVGVPVEHIDNYRDPKQYKEGTVFGFNQMEVEEIRNFQALFSAVVDLGAVMMRKYILEVNNLVKKDIGKFLLNEQSKGSFKDARLFPDQKTKMFTPNADIDKFDITILMCIIRNCCSLPKSFWTNPDDVLPNLVRIHQYRNGILAHTPSSRMSTKDFEVEWRKVEFMLHAAGAPKTDIDKYKMLRFTAL